jgi:hypothetical protein
MKKLFSCQYGSRLYGTQTPTSDVDWKHIVLPDINDLLLCKKIENKVKKTNTLANTRNGADDVDEEFIPLQVFARHFVEGQTYAIELAFAIDGYHAEQKIYDPRGQVTTYIPFRGEGSPMVAIRDAVFEETDYETPLFIDFVHELRTKFLTSNIKAMMGYVVNQASLYSFKGERLNATRELSQLINSLKEDDSLLDEEKATLFNCYTGTQYFRDTSEALARKFPKYFRKDEYDIGGGVMKPCFVILEKTLPFTNSISQTKKVLYALESKYGSRADAASESNVDWKATMHAMRIVDEGLQLLSENKLEFPFKPDYVAHLLSIRRGELQLDPIKEELSVKLDKLKELEKTTTLPTCNTEFLKEFDEWMVGWLHKFYNI